MQQQTKKYKKQKPQKTKTKKQRKKILIASWNKFIKSHLWLCRIKTVGESYNIRKDTTPRMKIMTLQKNGKCQPPTG